MDYRQISDFDPIQNARIECFLDAVIDAVVASRERLAEFQEIDW